MTQAMTAAERVRAAVKGDTVDRVPLCFWHHFKPEGSGERLAAYTLEFFHQKFDLDIIKIMPDLPYPRPTTPMTDPAQLLSLPRLSLNTPAFHEQLVCIRKLRAELGNDYPLVLTQFSPLTHLRYFLGKSEAAEAVRNSPEIVEQGMEVISANLRDLMSAAIDAGASGIFFSCMGATSADFTRDEYLCFGRPADLEALEGAKNGWLKTDKTLMGGLDERGPLTHGSEEELRNEILSAVTQTKGRRLILANGCSIPDDTPEEWLHTARRLIDDLK